MHEFTQFEQQPEPQASGRRFGPPGKRTGLSLLDPTQFPSIRPRCFGCSQRLTIAEIGRHILNCPYVAAEDLARFKTALAGFKLNPSRAREVVEAFLERVRMKSGAEPSSHPRGDRAASP